jgi:hypothetical protein
MKKTTALVWKTHGLAGSAGSDANFVIAPLQEKWQMLWAFQ